VMEDLASITQGMINSAYGTDRDGVASSRVMLVLGRLSHAEVGQPREPDPPKSG